MINLIWSTLCKELFAIFELCIMVQVVVSIIKVDTCMFYQTKKSNTSDQQNHQKNAAATCIIDKICNKNKNISTPGVRS